MKHTFLASIVSGFLIAVLPNSLQAQIPESCDCLVDTLGYASFIQTLNPNENAPFQFHVHGTFAVAYGVIGSNTPSVVQDLINNHPTVTTIVMHSCPGSEDDVSNLQASQLIHAAGYKMYLPVGGWIASGATDMFLAGSTRVVEVTVDPVGVHSWSDGTNEATDFPVGHAAHQLYIDYYVSVGFTTAEAEAFYYFTINAAPSNGIHWMTEAEIDQYKVRTCRYSANPNYTVMIDGSTLSSTLPDATYQWIDCATSLPIAGATNQSFTPSENGIYAVFINESACADTSHCQAVTVSSITSHDPFSAIEVYPNPTMGKVNIQMGVESLPVQISLFNPIRKLIQSFKHNQGTKLRLKFDEPSGIYFLRIQSQKGTSTFKVIKQ